MTSEKAFLGVLPIYTIPRLYEALERKTVEGHFQLMGRYLGAQRLEGQGLYVNLESSLEVNGLIPGDQILVEVSGACERKEESMVHISSAHFLRSLKSAENAYKSTNFKPLEFSQFLQDVYRFFVQKGLSCVGTPSLVPCGGMESTLYPLNVDLRLGKSSRQLITSPELHLKKLLSWGLTDIFEITKSYRDEEFSPIHKTEFYMLEWYRAYAGLELIKKDLKELFLYLEKQGWILGEKLSEKPFEEVSVSELFHKYCSISLQPETTLETLRTYLLDHKMLGSSESSSCSDWSWSDCFHLIFLNKIEPNLKGDKPYLVYDYPRSEAALANVDDRGWAQRFELYWRGVEMANAYDELTSLPEQEHRFEVENQKIQASGRVQQRKDEEYFKALEAGIPSSGGIAVGMERLFMAAQQLDNIHQVHYF